MPKVKKWKLGGWRDKSRFSRSTYFMSREGLEKMGIIMPAPEEGSDAGSQVTTPTQSRSATPTPGKSEKAEMILPHPSLIDWSIASPIPPPVLDMIAQTVPIRSEEGLEAGFELPKLEEMTVVAKDDLEKALEYHEQLMAMRDAIWAELLILFTPNVSLPFVTQANRTRFIKGLTIGMQRVNALVRCCAGLDSEEKPENLFLRTTAYSSYRPEFYFAEKSRIEKYHPLHPYRLLSPFLETLWGMTRNIDAAMDHDLMRWKYDGALDDSDEEDEAVKEEDEIKEEEDEDKGHDDDEEEEEDNEDYEEEEEDHDVKARGEGKGKGKEKVE